jgi:hypothetical protein
MGGEIMTRDELNQLRESLLAEYQAAKQFGQSKKMDEIRKRGMAVKERLNNMCSNCRTLERSGEHAEYCSQKCWDSYYPKRSSWDEAQAKIKELAKAKHIK